MFEMFKAFMNGVLIGIFIICLLLIWSSQYAHIHT